MAFTIFTIFAIFDSGRSSFEGFEVVNLSGTFGSLIDSSTVLWRDLFMHGFGGRDAAVLSFGGASFGGAGQDRKQHLRGRSKAPIELV